MYIYVIVKSIFFSARTNLNILFDISPGIYYEVFRCFNYGFTKQYSHLLAIFFSHCIHYTKFKWTLFCMPFGENFILSASVS